MSEQAEKDRLARDRGGIENWRAWGPYLSERQWGTVREDYSPDGSAWDYFSHDQARSRAYRWGEDGIAGISDEQQRLCFSLALWNGKDPILKERLFGLTGPQGNHGEDVKELYYYIDATPTHSYLKMLYKYPQTEYPYNWLVGENRHRSKVSPEFDLIDTGAFEEDKYFDVFVEYAKAGPDDILIKITVVNRGADAAPVHVLPQMWFRDTWSWVAGSEKPTIRMGDGGVVAEHPTLGRFSLYAEFAPRWLFCDNQTNAARVFGAPPGPGFFKDGFHDFIVQGRQEAVNPGQTGTKTAAHYAMTVPANSAQQIRLRLVKDSIAAPFAGYDGLFQARLAEADAFYAQVQAGVADGDARLVQRQAFAGMIWSKQLYYFDVPQWLGGDPACPPPPPQRKFGRDSEWTHLTACDVISMPDKWEYPWFAAWDLAFHTIPLAMIDPEFAKKQLLLLTKERYMHPNGQLPAYEWALGDVNPPVQAWTAWRVYQIDRDSNGGLPDTAFLKRLFHKLLLNFTWWVNRKDPQGRNIFQGGFLGLDNIGVFDRSRELPTGGFISQCDGTAWMAMYSLNLMRIALELSATEPAYQELATKFFEHFLYIAAALTDIGGQGIDLWDDQDEFFYDVLCLPDGSSVPLKVRSMVGLIPLFAVHVLDAQVLAQAPEFAERLEWFLKHRPDLAGLVSRWQQAGQGETRLLSLLRGHRMKCLLRRMLDETEFLSDYGVRALSRYHRENPYVFRSDGQQFTVDYEPAESTSGLFGGNSNWRGPIWMPVNFLIIESLRRFHSYYGDDFKVECPTRSGTFLTIAQIADELSSRLVRLFHRDTNGGRPVYNGNEKMRNDPNFRDLVLFHEYFHGDNGRGLGASHQTGWTGLIAALIGTQSPLQSLRGMATPVQEPLESRVHPT